MLRYVAVVINKRVKNIDFTLGLRSFCFHNAEVIIMNAENWRFGNVNLNRNHVTEN